MPLLGWPPVICMCGLSHSTLCVPKGKRKDNNEIIYPWRWNIQSSGISSKHPLTRAAACTVEGFGSTLSGFSMPAPSAVKLHVRRAGCNKRRTGEKLQEDGADSLMGLYSSGFVWILE